MLKRVGDESGKKILKYHDFLPGSVVAIPVNLRLFLSGPKRSHDPGQWPNQFCFKSKIDLNRDLNKKCIN